MNNVNNITIEFAGASLSVSPDVVSTVGDILGNSSYRLSLGFPENAQATVNGAVVNGSFRLSEGDEVILEQAAQTKGCDHISIEFAGASLNVPEDRVSTVADILGNSSYRLSLGFPENAQATVNGAVVNGTFQLSGGDEVILEQAAQTKGH